MGYPYGSTEFRLPNLLLPGIIRHLISSLLHPLGLSHYLLDPQTPSPTQPDSLPDPNPRSLSLSLSRFQDQLLPVMKFSDLVEDHPPPPEDCAVCLCTFDGGDEVRRLTNCRHVYMMEHACDLQRRKKNVPPRQHDPDRSTSKVYRL
ncbi:hypothetical protein RHSIM_Rhsim02G0234300 [Rhododendron simsii]|uniref:RING-type domain-containing protein n=1 Tax=Rhododendron simsii TaxID=118357 RepID=A0A834HD12_RHOSS|nr:hypothetical protein RHSIM_Rhsim02G0234300 [Rhododendron simsii]